LAFYLLTCEHLTTEGLYRLPTAYAITDLGWQSKAKRFQAAFEVLLEEEFVKYDHEFQVVLLPNALAWQAPTNPNQITAAVRKIRDDVPLETPLLKELASLAARLAPRLAQALREAFPDALQQSPTPAPSLQSQPSGGMGLSASAGGHLGDLDDEGVRF
jgi:hypothetical protein